MSWEDKALNSPLVSLWWNQMKQLDPQYSKMDMLEFMRNDPSRYNYKLAIEKGFYPEYQPEHKQYRWSDIGKGSDYIAPDKTQIKQNDSIINIAKLLGLI